MGFECAQSDHGLYIFSRDDIRIFVPVFVDDITLAGKKSAKFDSLIEELSSNFKLRDLGPTTQLLGLEIHRDRPNRTLSVSQSQFITNLLQEHGLQDCKPVSTPLNPGCRLSTSMLVFLLYYFIVLRRRLSTNLCGSTTRHLAPFLI